MCRRSRSTSPTSRCRCGRRPRRSLAPSACRRPTGPSPGPADRRSRATCSIIRDIVAGKRVLDLAAGSGLVAIAAAKAGAAPVIAADIDAFTEAAIALNAEANDVYVEIITQDLLDRAGAGRAALRRHPGRRPVLRARHRGARARLPRPQCRERHARADRRSRPHLSAEGAPHAARRIFGAGDARARGHGDQADERVGADVRWPPKGGAP